MKWDTLPNKKIIDKTIAALTVNGMDAIFIADGKAAKAKVLSLLPKGAEVMTMTSVTLDTIGLTQEITQSSDYDAVKNKLMKMDRKAQSLDMQKLGSAPEWTIGSVHALTQDGHAVIASNTGSQLPAYAYGSPHVIWVVGAQKIVKDIQAGMDRIDTHTLPLESERVKEAYGMPHSEVKKLLIIKKEATPERITVLIVNEVLGF